MDLTFVYQKKRSEFGKQCMFSDKGPELIDDFPSCKKHLREYILRDPVDRSALCVPIQAEHELNTLRAEYANGAMNHIEGGWPKDVNKDDEEQTKRYRRKTEKDEGFQHTIMQLFKNMESCILQNNAINIYQQYYSDVEPTPLVEASTARTLNVFQDQNPTPRPVNRISWSPDNQTKMAISYCDLQFQADTSKDNMCSLIWEVENSNTPLMALKADDPIVCMEYNPKEVNLLISGQLNGQVAAWDLRKGNEPVEMSLPEASFRDPVQNVLWINSKSGAEFFSASTDGYVKWWDIRKMAEPMEVLILDYCKDEDQVLANAMGASCLEYETTIPTRFMVGTEQGIIISCNRKGKTALEKMTMRIPAHTGPIRALQRSPAFIKNFLTIGDWSAKIWSEDCRESSIIWTGFHKAVLTDGAWSPTRISVFFTTRSDGVLDVWDLLQQQKSATLSVKVCDDSLRCIKTHDMGKLVAVGSQKGTTYLVQFSDNLSVCNKNDKMLLTAMFEREGKREKILEARNREYRLKQKGKQGAGDDDEQMGDHMPTDADADFDDNLIKQAEAEFFEIFEAEKRAAMRAQEKNAEEEQDEQSGDLFAEEEPEVIQEEEPMPPQNAKERKRK